MFREEIPKGFPTGFAIDQSGAICTAAWLAIKGVSWAAQLADSNWPQSGELQFSILKNLPTPSGHPWLDKKVIEFLSTVSEFPRSLLGLKRVAPHPWDKAVSLAFGQTDASKSVVLQLPASNSRPFFLRFTSCRDPNSGQWFEQLPTQNALWETFRHCGKFFANPTKLEMAATLSDLALRDDWESVRKLPRPWPLRTGLRAAASTESLRSLADQATRGELGDREDWLAAEARWAGGVTVEDIIAFDQNSGMIGPYIRERGFPIGAGASARPDLELRATLAALLDTFKVLRHRATRSVVAGYTLFAAALLSRKLMVQEALALDLETTLSLAREAAADETQDVNLDGLIAFSAGRTTPDWISAFDEIGQFPRIIFWGPNPERSKFSSMMAEAFTADTSRRGLVRILGRFAGDADDIDSAPPQIPSSLLNKLDWTDRPYRTNLIFLQLANPSLPLEETTNLAKRIATLVETSEGLVARSLGIARRCLSAPVQEKLAMEVCEALPPWAFEARSATFNFIDDLLRLHRSQLGDQSMRTKLKLPGPAQQRPSREGLEH